MVHVWTGCGRLWMLVGCSTVCVVTVLMFPQLLALLSPESCGLS